MHPLRVTYHLYQAVIVLAQVDGHWPSDPAHPIHDIILAASNTLIWISKLLDKLLIKQNTTRVIASLKESKVDYTLLLYLQLPDPLRMKSEFISYLQSLCIQKNADFKSSFFYTCVWDYFEHEGVAPITPEKYIASNRKEDILKMYERAKKTWGKHSPLFLQTYDYDTKEGKFTNHLYHISRTAQDGILRLLDILKAGEFVVNGKLYTACGAIEHVVSPSTLSCQIYDCEIMSSVFDGRKSTEEIKEMVQCFPAYISSTMHKVGLINPETFITFEVKDRTRMTDPKTQNIKISYHFTPNICAPKYIHHKAAEICLREFKDRIDEAAVSIKSTGILPESLLSHDSSDSVYAFDCGAIKNGITTAFSRKKKSDAFSRLVYTEEVYEGCAIDRRECLKDPQDLQGDNLTVECRCMLVFKQLYTTPKKEILCYAASAMEAFETESKETEKKNGAAPRPAPNPQRAIDEGSSNNLPEWLLSALKEITGRGLGDVRSNLPFLDKLKDTLPLASRDATLYHVPSTLCAKELSMGKCHSHDKNATVFAVDSRLNVVYATCSTGAHKITENTRIKVVNMYSKTNRDGSVQPVESVKGKCVHWVMIDEEAMTRLLVETVMKRGAESPTKKKKI